MAKKRTTIPEEIERLVPGVGAAYEALKANSDKGLYTSAGAFYNHTFFGRDSSTTARFTGAFDHEVAFEAILALAELQGHKVDRKTQESPGRIHHEERDFRMWKGKLSERWLLKLTSYLWGGTSERFLTYFSSDTTASFIKLVHMYAKEVDASIIDRTIKNQYSMRRTVGSSVALAADWVKSCVDDEGIVSTTRSNTFSIPFQTYQDSVSAYAFQNGTSANFVGPIAYVEVQALSADALRYAAELLPDHPRASAWRHVADRISHALLEKFWMPEKQFFASALDRSPRGKWRQIDSLNISGAWVLDSTVFHALGNESRQHYIGPIVERIFSEDFLSDVGVRTRSLGEYQPMGDIIDYHGNTTVWPMFNYMVSQGLRRHHLVRLAEQLEFRMLNGVNHDGHFSEFFIVLENGHVVNNPLSRKTMLPGRRLRGIQMMPEQNIAFTVVPCMAAAHRIASTDPLPTQRPWQTTLEDRILHDMPRVRLALSSDSLDKYINVDHDTVLNRQKGLMRTFRYMVREGVRLR